MSVTGHIPTSYPNPHTDFARNPCRLSVVKIGDKPLLGRRILNEHRQELG